jgi:hypothetical protein
MSELATITFVLPPSTKKPPLAMRIVLRSSRNRCARTVPPSPSASFERPWVARPVNRPP